MNVKFHSSKKSCYIKCTFIAISYSFVTYTPIEIEIFTILFQTKIAATSFYTLSTLCSRGTSLSIIFFNAGKGSGLSSCFTGIIFNMHTSVRIFFDENWLRLLEVGLSNSLIIHILY